MTPARTNYWMNRVADEKAAEALAVKIARDEHIENNAWRGLYALVCAAGIAMWFVRTVVVGGPAAIPFFLVLALFTIGMTIGAWRMGNRD